jgi:thiamine biosynthesis lipoprotein
MQWSIRKLEWVCLLGLFVGGSCAAPRLVEPQRFEFSRPEMGLPFRMLLYATDQPHAEAAALAAFTRIRELNDIFTDYDSDSELSRLSQSSGEGKAVAVSPDLWAVLSRAQVLSARTEGAFDITVGPYVNLWRKARRDKALPSAERLARARGSVGYRNVKLDPGGRKVELLVPDMRLDLGGIAKGYAIDEALKVLMKQGIRSALVSGGGDLAVTGAPPGRKGWRIEVAPLDVEGAPPPRFVGLTFKAMATSGDVFQRLEVGGQRYSHIVDPRTGVGLTDHSLVTVIANDCTTADGLATAVSVLGPVDGLELLESRRGVVGQIIRKPGETIERIETRGFRRHLDESMEPVVEGELP